MGASRPQGLNIVVNSGLGLVNNYKYAEGSSLLLYAYAPVCYSLTISSYATPRQFSWYKKSRITSLIIVIIAIIVKEGVTTFQDFDSLVTNQGQKLNECHSLARTGSKWPKGVPRSKSLSIGMDGVTNFQVIDSLVTFHGQKINEFNILAWKGLEWPKGVCRHKGVCRSKGPSIIGNRIAVATLSTTESVSSLIIALTIAEPKPTFDSHLYMMVINLHASVATDFDHDQKIIVSRSPRGGPYKMEIVKISSYFSLPKISLIILSVEFKDNIIVNIQYKMICCFIFDTNGSIVLYMLNEPKYELLPLLIASVSLNNCKRHFHNHFRNVFSSSKGDFISRKCFHFRNMLPHWDVFSCPKCFLIIYKMICCFVMSESPHTCKSNKKLVSFELNRVCISQLNIDCLFVPGATPYCGHGGPQQIKGGRIRLSVHKSDLLLKNNHG